MRRRDQNYGCEARQFSDQKVCNRCDLIWDMNDPEPPKCMTGHELFLREREKLKYKVDSL